MSLASANLTTYLPLSLPEHYLALTLANPPFAPTTRNSYTITFSASTVQSPHFVCNGRKGRTDRTEKRPQYRVGISFESKVQQRHRQNHSRAHIGEERVLRRHHGQNFDPIQDQSSERTDPRVAQTSRYAEERLSNARYCSRPKSRQDYGRGGDQDETHTG